MKLLATATVVLLLVLLCNGREYHRRLEERRRQEAEELLQRRRAALTSAQTRAVAKVRHSVSGGGSPNIDYGSTNSYTGRSRQVYPPPSPTNYLPVGSKFCPGSTSYYCDVEAKCVYSENGVWKCQFETSHTISRNRHFPTVIRIRVRRTGDESTGDERTGVDGTGYGYTGYGRTGVDRIGDMRVADGRTGDRDSRQHSRLYPVRPPQMVDIRHTYTGYKCGSGLKLLATSSSTCVDIDECEPESNECSQTCKNTFGSFYCVCESGYTLTGTTQCVAQNRVRRSPQVYPVPSRTNYLPVGSKFCPGSTSYYCDVEARCVYSENGVWKCQFETSHTISRNRHLPTVTRIGDRRTGYGRTGYGSTRDGRTGDERTGVGRTGYGYTGYGRTAYGRTGDGRAGERRTGDGHTRQHSRFYPLRPPYGGNIRHTYTRYKCGSGLKRLDTSSSNFNCVDIDECEPESNECSQTCKNTYGSFYCVCERGYKRNGTTQCVDRDECVDLGQICSPAAVCLNTEGSYTCECIDGYKKDDVNSRLCHEINECKDNKPCAEDEICFNTWGSYECDLPTSCPEGYVRPNTSAVTDQNCIRDAVDAPGFDIPQAINFKKIAVEARKYPDAGRPLASMTFLSGDNYEYDHRYEIRVLNGSENFWYRKRPTPARSPTNKLNIDFYNRKGLKPNVNLPFIILITDRMTPKRPSYRTYGNSYNRYGYQSRSYNRPRSRQIKNQRKVVMNIVPMVHGTAEDN